MTDTQSLLDEARSVLQLHFGYGKFKAAQEQVILAALNGEDVLAVLQTGYGKSVCFQVPAAMRDGCAIVISPLIALMKDQVDGANRRGIAASFVNSSLDPADVTKRLSEFASGAFKLLYVAPERIGTQQFRAALAKATVSFIVVDEAHCHPPDTLITMADGSLRRVDEVAVGERVLTRALDGTLRSQCITQHRRIAVGERKLLRLCFAHGYMDVTDDHKIYVERGGCEIQVEAGNLRVGDTVLCALQGASLTSSGLQARAVLQPNVSRCCATGCYPGAARRSLPDVWHEVRRDAWSRGEVLQLQVLARDCSFDPGESALRRVPTAVLASEAHTQEAVLFETMPLCVARPADLDQPTGSQAVAGRSETRGCRESGWNEGAESAAQGATAARTRSLRSSSPQNDQRFGAARSRALADESRGGVRWAYAHAKSQAEGAGCFSRSLVGVVRLEGVEVLEPRDPAGRRARGSDCRLVHSLTVDVDHNYFAGTARVLTKNCASMWGHDFRPAFGRIHEVSSLLWEATGSRPPIIAVTATATADIENDIAAAVGMTDGYTRVVGDPIRPNLTYDAIRGMSEWSTVMRVARSRFHMPGKHLVYASTRKGTEKVAEMLNQDFGKGFAAAYHGGMDKDDRTRVQDDFVSGRVLVVVATNAFGMGIDVPDIRTVVHLGVPGSIESYVQETGRAGRDGDASTVVLIDSDFSVNLQRSFIAGNNPPIQLYVKLWNWLIGKCSGGTVLRLSASSIAESLSGQSAEDVSEAAVSTILNVLEGHKLIGRDYYEGGAPVTVRMDDESVAHLRKSKVGSWLLRKAEAHRAGGGSIEISVDKTDAPFEIGISARAFSKELTELDLADAINVGRVFTGKTTTMLQPDAELLTVLPIEMIEKKRKRDLDRFEAMLRYSRLGAHQERVQFVRNYFLNNGQ